MLKMTSLGLYLISWTLFCTCLAIPDIHKQMTKDQLRSIFHVEHHDLVPNYELVQLLHQGTSHNSDSIASSVHSINKRSINNNNLNELNNNNNNNNSNINNSTIIKSHHVKKDLSKTPYYSELKLQKNSVKINNFDNNNDDSYKNSNLNNNNNNSINKNINLSQIKEHNVSFSAFGETLNLTLKPTKGLFKNGPQSLRMWMADLSQNSTQGVDYEEVIQDPKTENEHIGEIFQDEQNMAAILMRRQLQNGDLVMEGSIGHDIVIKPLPHELNPNKDQTHHVIYKRNVDPMDQVSDFALMEPDEFFSAFDDDENNDDDIEGHIRRKRATTRRRNGRTIRRFARGRRAVPYTIYPEILCIVDYDGYRLHGGDNVQVKRYFVSFWNGVDLRYRLLKGPRIHISIAGIIISRGRDATPYLERNRVGRDAIDSAAALTDMGKYLFRERRLPVYDIAVAITKLDLCKRSYAYGECKRGTAGFAYVGGACVVNKRLEKVNSVAIIEDTGGFSGIIVAAHEVGHLLGAVHDGSPPPSYLGGPGAAACRWEDGYIMSDLRHTERGFRWSPCTIQSFHHFLNGDTATCLHNTPHEDHSLGRQLPGTLLSLDAQCRRDRGTYACFKDDRVCAQLFCFDSSTGYCVAYRPAAEGSSCGNGLHCLDGRCVPQHSNLINSYRPVYSSDDDDDNDDEDEQDNENDDDDNNYQDNNSNEDDNYDESTVTTASTTINKSTTPTTTTTTKPSKITTHNSSKKNFKFQNYIENSNFPVNSTVTITKTTHISSSNNPYSSSSSSSSFSSTNLLNDPSNSATILKESFNNNDISTTTTTTQIPTDKSNFPNINPIFYGFFKYAQKFRLPTTTVNLNNTRNHEQYNFSSPSQLSSEYIKSSSRQKFTSNSNEAA